MLLNVKTKGWLNTGAGASPLRRVCFALAGKLRALFLPGLRSQRGHSTAQHRAQKIVRYLLFDWAAPEPRQPALLEMLAPAPGQTRSAAPSPKPRAS